MKKRKPTHKLIAIILVATLLVAFVGCAGKGEKDSEKKRGDNGNKFETAVEATANMGAGWSLGNSLDAFNSSLVSRSPSAWETCWNNPVTTKELIETIYKAGFKTIRIPVTWLDHLDSEGNIYEEWLDRVQEVVDYCYEYNLYVIINMHHDTGAEKNHAWVKAEATDYNNGMAKYKKIWTQIAERFSSYDGHLLFEAYNEMLDGNNTWNNPQKASSYDIVNKWAQIFVDAVRATGGNNAERNLIISTYAASFQSKCLTELKLPNDTVENHLIVEIHMYSPYEFCDNEKGVVDKHSTFTSEYAKNIKKTFELIKTTFVDKGIPVIIGEFAANNKNNTEERVKYVQCYVEQCKAIGAAYIWWDNGLKTEMGLFSRSTYECWFPEIVEEIVK